MSKPTTLPAWCSSGTNILEPTSTQKAQGFGLNGALPSSYANWLFKAESDWINWLNSFEATAHTWTAQQTFATAGGAVVANSTNSYGVLASSHASSGLYATSDLGQAVLAEAFAAGQPTIEARGNTRAVWARGLANNAIGLYGDATLDLNDNPITGGIGVYGEGGAKGVSGVSDNGRAVEGISASAVGVYGSGGTYGVWATGLEGVHGESATGIGVRGSATGAGTGVRADCATAGGTALSIAATHGASAISSTGGDVTITGGRVDNSTVLKALGRITWNHSTTLTLTGGFGVATYTASGNIITLTFNYTGATVPIITFSGWVDDGAGGYAHIINAAQLASSGAKFQLVNNAGSAVNVTSCGGLIDFMVAWP